MKAALAQVSMGELGGRTMKQFTHIGREYFDEKKSYMVLVRRLGDMWVTTFDNWYHVCDGSPYGGKTSTGIRLDVSTLQEIMVK